MWRKLCVLIAFNTPGQTRVVGCLNLAQTLRNDSRDRVYVVLDRVKVSTVRCRNSSPGTSSCTRVFRDRPQRTASRRRN